MGNTYKDRDRKGLPRVPKWARPRPERVHRNKKRQPSRDEVSRDDYLRELWEKDDRNGNE